MDGRSRGVFARSVDERRIASAKNDLSWSDRGRPRRRRPPARPRRRRVRPRARASLHGIGIFWGMHGLAWAVVEPPPPTPEFCRFTNPTPFTRDGYGSVMATESGGVSWTPTAVLKA